MEKLYLTAQEVADALGVSKQKSYVIIRECNKALKEQGYIITAGKLPKKYFQEKYYM